MSRLLPLVALLTCAAASPPRATILLVADDLGHNEMGFQNCSRGLQTPHLDALSAAGVRLTHYYTHPLCSPTRSAMMTGRYDHRFGLQSNVVYWDTPWGVPLTETFLPQALKDIPGFGNTAMFGKVRTRRSFVNAAHL
jgi:arylsulfatase I/J